MTVDLGAGFVRHLDRVRVLHLRNGWDDYRSGGLCITGAWMQEQDDMLAPIAYIVCVISGIFTRNFHPPSETDCG